MESNGYAYTSKQAKIAAKNVEAALQAISPMPSFVSRMDYDLDKLDTYKLGELTARLADTAEELRQMSHDLEVAHHEARVQELSQQD